MITSEVHDRVTAEREEDDEILTDVTYYCDDILVERHYRVTEPVMATLTFCQNIT